MFKIFINIVAILIVLNSDAQNNNIFIGGSGDGITSSSYSQVANISRYLGGEADGVSSNNYIQSSNTSRYIGGNADGVSSNNYIQGSDTSRFLGGNADGVSSNNYIQDANTSRFLGGQADGYATTFVPAIPLAPLPLTLISFQGSKLEDTHVLNWVTADEDKIDHYDLQRSGNSYSWNTIYNTLSKGNGDHHYEFIDQFPIEGDNFYKLKIVDDLGKITWSNIVLLNKQGKDLFQLMPNPTSGVMQIITSYDQYKYRILSSIGTVLQEGKVDQRIHTLDFSNYTTGQYIIQIITNQKMSQYKIIKK